MHDDDSAPSRAPGLFIPFVLLAAGLLLCLIWQITSVQSQRSEIKTTKAKLIEAIQKREPQVAQAAEIKKRLEALAFDLLELSKTDPTAQAIVKKYDMQRALPTAGAAAGK